jgi:hypothetical protein
VDEGVLRRARDGRVSLTAEKLLAPERAQQLADVLVARAARDRPQPIGPHDGAHHRCIAQKLLLGLREEVDAGGDDAEDAVGKTGGGAARGLHARELLGVEGISRSTLDDGRPELVVGRVTPQE